MDNYHTHFYLLLLQGQKRVTVFAAGDRAALYYNEFLKALRVMSKP